jgi:hypothetical protein
VPLGRFKGSYAGSGTEIKEYSLLSGGISQFTRTPDMPKDPRQLRNLDYASTKSDNFIGVGITSQYHSQNLNLYFTAGFGFGLTDQNIPVFRPPSAVLRGEYNSKYW